MNEIVSNLLVYGSLPEDSILWQLADICEKLKDGTETKAALRGRVFHQVKNLLTVATDYAFDKNLWHNYLTFLLITNENPFSLVCEKMGAQEGTVNNFVTHDFDMFKELFDYDFSWLEKELSIDCFTQLTHYQAIRKKELMYNKNVSEKVRNLSEKLETAESGADFFQYVTEFYKDYGVGMFGLNKAFRIAENKDGSIRFLPINNMDTVMLGDGWDEDISPLSAMVRDGKMYGRGACDMKSGLACALTTFKNMVKKVGEKGELPQKPFAMICSVDEEDFMRGVEAAIKAGWVTKDDWILDTEPTDGQIQVAHKGRTWFELTMTGITAHASNPWKGADAVAAMAEAVSYIRKSIAACPSHQRDQSMPGSP